MKLFAMENETFGDGTDTIVSDIMPLNITEDNLLDVYTEFKEQEASLENFINDMKRGFIAVEAMNNLIKAKEEGASKVALEGFADAANMAAVGTASDPKSIINPALSLEAMMHQRDSALGRLAHGFKTLGQKYADFIHYYYSIFEFQSSRVRKLLSELNKGPDSKTVRLSVNKWIVHGQPAVPVKTGAEYAEEFKKMVNILAPLSSSLDELVDSDIFGWFKWVKAIATANTDSFIEERTELVRKHITALAKNSSMKKEKEENGVILYATEVLLGEFQFVVSVPNEKITISKDIKPHLFDVHLERASKFNMPDWTKDDVEIEFTKKDLKVVLDASTRLLAEIKKLNSLGTRVAQIGTYNQIFNPVGYVGELISAMTQSGQLAIHVSAIVLSTLSGTHHLGFGNVKQAARITEKYLK